MIAAGRRMEWLHCLTIGTATGFPTAGLMLFECEEANAMSECAG